VWLASQAPIAGLDGVEMQVTAISGNRYDEVGRHLSADVALWPRPLVFFASPRTMDRLTDAQRRVLRDAARAAAPAQIQRLEQDEREAAGVLCRRGLEFTAAGGARVATLRRAVQPVYDALGRDPRTRQAIAAIQALRSDAGSDRPLRCAPAATPVSRSSPLDGVWRMRTTYDDQPDDPEPVPENYGDWIIVLDRGRFADTQQYDGACTWGYGKYAISGHRMTWTFTDGGGIAPTGAENKPGERFRFGWSLYRDTVTLTGVRGAVSPENFRLRPWRRVSETPSRRRFARRCPPPLAALPG
jgi:extracellular solute-binding protein (family 7)